MAESNREKFVASLLRILNSAKAKTAALSAVSAWVAAHYAAKGLPEDQRIWLWVAFLGSVVVLTREVLSGWTQEDVAAKSAPLPPAVNVQTGIEPRNVQAVVPQPEGSYAPVPTPTIPPMSRPRVPTSFMRTP